MSCYRMNQFWFTCLKFHYKIFILLWFVAYHHKLVYFLYYIILLYGQDGTQFSWVSAKLAVRCNQPKL